MTHKAGFVSIIGKPNVGKSTLLNALLGQRLSIVTSKAQTTRHRIKGILSDENYQVVFSDTPGILDPHYLLQQKMMDFVHASIADADAVLFITDLEESYLDKTIVSLLTKIKKPVIVIINKTDLSSTNEINKLVSGWNKTLKPFAIIPASALVNYNLDIIKDTLLEVLPEAPAYFDKDTISDLSQRFFVAEIIREKIFLNYEKEIPYSSEVVVHDFKEEKTIIRIGAYIIVERESQKSIVIGNKGESLKRVGTLARKDIEKFLAKKVFLELFVKVDKDWRRKELQLKRYGYGG